MAAVPSGNPSFGVKEYQYQIHDGYPTSGTGILDAYINNSTGADYTPTDSLGNINPMCGFSVVTGGALSWVMMGGSTITMTVPDNFEFRGIVKTIKKLAASGAAANVYPWWGSKT